MASVSAKKRKSGVDIKIEENWEPDVTVPPREPDGDDDEPDNVAEGSSQTKEVVAALCKQRLIPSDLELQLQQYFKERPRIKPLPLSQSFVDIDLTDPDEETWIIQCPASVDVKVELMNKKLNLTAPRSTIKNCSVPLEAHVQYNRNERVVGLQSGTRVKSFVPVGFVRIHEALPPLAEPVLQDASNVSDVTVPYPEELRERHPLLGYDFKEYLALPKRVPKRLALAQQKAELLYKNTPLVASNQSPQTADNALTAGTGEQTVTVKPVPPVGTPSKSRKRKEPPPVEENALEVVPIKQEPPSPKRKKQQNDEEVQTVSVKQEVTMEDDISWLLNI